MSSPRVCTPKPNHPPKYLRHWQARLEGK